MARIEIAGGIASGKTTLTKLIAQHSQFEGVYENFKDNPFWSKFYHDTQKWVKEKNFAFLIQHVAQIKEIDYESLVCDYALLQDIAYASLVRPDGHATLMRQLCAQLAESIPSPSLLVHLQCPSEVLIERIAKRARPEETNITIEYLENLNLAIEAEVNFSLNRQKKIYRINSDQVNFTSDEASRCYVDEIVQIASA